MQDPHTPRGSVAGIDAWSSGSSGGSDHSLVRRGQSGLNLNESSKTNVSVVVQQVVGELEAVKRHGLLHPLGSAGR